MSPHQVPRRRLAPHGRKTALRAAALLAGLAAVALCRQGECPGGPDPWLAPAQARSEKGPAPVGPAPANVKAYGAKGDGKADDTRAIQAAVDDLAPRGGTLLFPPGTYLVTSVGLRPGIHYLGYGATIKRPPRQGKFVRTFDAGREGYVYSGDVDSPPLTIEGLTFDGSRAEQGEYTSYQLEQAHLLFLRADPAKAGRLQVRLLHCEFKDGVADAVSLYTNVAAQVSNCTARDCFRGGLVITGGHTRAQVTNFTAAGKAHPTGIDLEVDGAGFGGSRKVEVALDNVLLPDGDFDVGVDADSVVLGNNIVAAAPFHVYGGGTATMRFSNSTFGVGEYSGDANRIVLPGHVTFSNCTFAAEGRSDGKPRRWACAHVYWGVGGRPGKGQSVAFVDCDFRVGQGIGPKDTTYAVYLEADHPANGNLFRLEGGTVHAGFTHGVFAAQGGRLAVRGADLRAKTALRLGSSPDYPLDARLEALEVGGCKTYLHQVTHHPENVIRHVNVELDEAQNVLGTDYGITRNDYRGRRVILGARPPSASTPGLLNDVYRLKAPAPGKTYEWVCTRPGAGAGAEWKPLQAVAE